MFFLFLLSVLQICFIPGFIVYLLLNRKSNDPDILLVPVISFGLSLIINYIIVSFLAYFHFYTRSSIIILLITEFIVLATIFIFRRQYNMVYVHKMAYTGIIEEIKLLISARKSRYEFFRSILFILSVLLLIFLVILLILNTGKIFQDGDAIFSWNRWAKDFANNRLPSGTYHYPQLIPANWSVSYVLCQYPLQFIPKGIMPLFLIFPVYSFIYLGIKQRSTFYFSSAFLFFLSSKMLNWRDGWVDVPVAFFSIIIYICLNLIKKEDHDTDKNKYILLSIIFACGSAVTKQSGLFVILIYPLILFILTKNKFAWSYQKILKFSLFFLGMLIIIVMPFYVNAELQIKNGLNTSEIKYVTNEIYNGASYFERFLYACIRFSDVFSGRIIFVLCIYPYLLSFTDKTFRLLSFSFVLPYSFIWAIFFSYDVRNSAIIIPYFCLCIGVGLDIILKRLLKSPSKNESFEKQQEYYN